MICGRVFGALNFHSLSEIADAVYLDVAHVFGRPSRRDLSLTGISNCRRIGSGFEGRHHCCLSSLRSVTGGDAERHLNRRPGISRIAY
jgi:hypothetical protein